MPNMIYECPSRPCTALTAMLACAVIPANVAYLAERGSGHQYFDLCWGTSSAFPNVLYAASSDSHVDTFLLHLPATA